ncbi:hypothetical protein GGX14DRAFT_662082 [Mycena pura]|uniref:Uncharacterized protein n=1 Tax=Mycena pura TaxID=153505 RepID=A0AAD6Y3K0_9AGAR|nr:hypothetical protein GGX14DRAFT_662082 [Mycena pura]
MASPPVSMRRHAQCALHTSQPKPALPATLHSESTRRAQNLMVATCCPPPAVRALSSGCSPSSAAHLPPFVARCPPPAALSPIAAHRPLFAARHSLPPPSPAPQSDSDLRKSPKISLRALEVAGGGKREAVGGVRQQLEAAVGNELREVGPSWRNGVPSVSPSLVPAICRITNNRSRIVTTVPDQAVLADAAGRYTAGEGRRVTDGKRCVLRVACTGGGRRLLRDARANDEQLLEVVGNERREVGSVEAERWRT